MEAATPRTRLRSCEKCKEHPVAAKVRLPNSKDVLLLCRECTEALQAAAIAKTRDKTRKRRFSLSGLRLRRKSTTIDKESLSGIGDSSSSSGGGFEAHMAALSAQLSIEERNGVSRDADNAEEAAAVAAIAEARSATLQGAPQSSTMRVRALGGVEVRVRRDSIMRQGRPSLRRTTREDDDAVEEEILSQLARKGVRGSEPTNSTQETKETKELPLPEPTEKPAEEKESKGEEKEEWRDIMDKEDAEAAVAALRKAAETSAASSTAPGANRFQARIDRTPARTQGHLLKQLRRNFTVLKVSDFYSATRNGVYTPTALGQTVHDTLESMARDCVLATVLRDPERNSQFIACVGLGDFVALLLDTFYAPKSTYADFGMASVQRVLDFATPHAQPCRVRHTDPLTTAANQIKSTAESIAVIERDQRRAVQSVWSAIDLLRYVDETCISISTDVVSKWTLESCDVFDEEDVLKVPVTISAIDAFRLLLLQRRGVAAIVDNSANDQLLALFSLTLVRFVSASNWSRLQLTLLDFIEEMREWTPPTDGSMSESDIQQAKEHLKHHLEPPYLTPNSSVREAIDVLCSSSNPTGVCYVTLPENESAGTVIGCVTIYRFLSLLLRGQPSKLLRSLEEVRTFDPAAATTAGGRRKDIESVVKGARKSNFLGIGGKRVALHGDAATGGGDTGDGGRERAPSNASGARVYSILGVDLTILLSIERTEDSIPVVVREILTFLEKHAEASDVCSPEMQFNSLDVQRLTQHFDSRLRAEQAREGGKLAWEELPAAHANPASVSALLRLFLSSLREPVIPFSLFNDFMAAAKLPPGRRRHHALHCVLLSLPPTHQVLMGRLIAFMHFLQCNDASPTTADSLALFLGAELVQAPSGDEIQSKLVQYAVRDIFLNAPSTSMGLYTAKELQAQFPLLKTTKRFDLAKELETTVKSGWLQKKSAAFHGKWQKRYFCLKSHFLLYFKQESDDVPCGLCDLRGGASVELADRTLASDKDKDELRSRFSVKMSDKTFVLQSVTNSEEDALDWVSSIRLAIDRSNAESKLNVRQRSGSVSVEPRHRSPSKSRLSAVVERNND